MLLSAPAPAEMRSASRSITRRRDSGGAIGSSVRTAATRGELWMELAVCHGDSDIYSGAVGTTTEEASLPCWPQTICNETFDMFHPS